MPVWPPWFERRPTRIRPKPKPSPRNGLPYLITVKRAYKYNAHTYDAATSSPSLRVNHNSEMKRLSSRSRYCVLQKITVHSNRKATFPRLPREAWLQTPLRTDSLPSIVIAPPPWARSCEEVHTSDERPIPCFCERFSPSLTQTLATPCARTGRRDSARPVCHVPSCPSMTQTIPAGKPPLCFFGFSRTKVCFFGFSRTKYLALRRFFLAQHIGPIQLHKLIVMWPPPSCQAGRAEKSRFFFALKPVAGLTCPHP